MLDVLIPHFNSAKDLEISLESVAAQTWKGSLRVIVFDDGSTADMFARVERIVAQSPLDIKLLRSEDNLGRPKARNALLSAAGNRFVAWLDAGDIWYPEKIQRQFDQLYKLHLEGVDINSIWVTCHYDWQWEGRRRRKCVQDTHDDQLHRLFSGDRLRAYLWTLLGTRQAFMLASRFDERLLRLQDLDYFISFVRAGGRLVSAETSQPLCCYFKSDIGRNADEIHKCYDTIFAKHAEAINQYGPKYARRIRAKSDFVAARFAFNNGDRVRGLGYRVQALLTDPYYSAFRAKKYLLKA